MSLPETNYTEVTCSKSTSDTEFVRGLQDFVFSIGAPNVFIPSKSYFRVELQVDGVGGAAAPSQQEQIALADHACASMYSNVYFRAGGQDVSSVTQFAAQSAMVKSRTTTPSAWQKSIGRNALLQEPDFQKRVAYTSSDIYHPSLLTGGAFMNLGATGFYNTGSIVVTSGAHVGTNTALDLLDINDAIVIGGIEYTVTTASSNAAGTGLVTSPAVPDGTYTTSIEYTGVGKAKTLNETEGKNKIFAIFQPPVGIFQHPDAMGAGDYRFSLNPNNDFETSMIQTARDMGVSPTNFKLTINGVRLYIATAKMSIPDKVETLDLLEIQCQTKTADSNNNVLQFTVPPSTEMLSFFVQSSDAGKNTAVPPTSFICKDKSQNLLTNVQVTYAGTTKPSTRWASTYIDGAGGTNQLQQRYIESLHETGMYNCVGGAPSFLEWLQSGVLVSYRFDRDRANLATQVQLQMDFTAIEANARVFLAATYRKSTKITTSNGMVTAVESLMI